MNGKLSSRKFLLVALATVVWGVLVFFGKLPPEMIDKSFYFVIGLNGGYQGLNSYLKVKNGKAPVTP